GLAGHPPHAAVKPPGGGLVAALVGTGDAVDDAQRVAQLMACIGDDAAQPPAGPAARPPRKPSCPITQLAACPDPWPTAAATAGSEQLTRLNYGQGEAVPEDYCQGEAGAGGGDGGAGGAWRRAPAGGRAGPVGARGQGQPRRPGPGRGY